MTMLSLVFFAAYLAGFDGHLVAHCFLSWVFASQMVTEWSALKSSRTRHLEVRYPDSVPLFFINFSQSCDSLTPGVSALNRWVSSDKDDDTRCLSDLASDTRLGRRATGH